MDHRLGSGQIETNATRFQTDQKKRDLTFLEAANRGTGSLSITLIAVISATGGNGKSGAISRSTAVTSGTSVSVIGGIVK